MGRRRAVIGITTLRPVADGDGNRHRRAVTRRKRTVRSPWRTLIRLAAAALLAILATTPAADARVDEGSVITTVAGSKAGFGGDGGPAVQALLNQPRDTAVAPDGSIYVADTYNNRIRRISPDGTITTVAGTGSSTYNGDNMPATAASLSWPHDVTVDSNGVVYVADSAHHRIRKITPDGVISTVAGTGLAGSNGENGAATSARIRNPKSVALYGGALYFSSLEQKVRRVDLTTGTITTIAGTGVIGYSGDGGRQSRQPCMPLSDWPSTRWATSTSQTAATT